jgi:ATP-dependent Clp protease protease subunit|tara:strand:- start:2997 stop:3599 length:603 start_codon:yes stop_codon:yes gene_type:complete
MVKESNKDKNSQPKTQQQPMQPGMMMWDAGIMYFSDGFDSQTTKPVIQAIIEKNLMPNTQRPKELTLVINSPGGQVHSAFALIDTMKGSAIPVKTVGIGMIASCGLLTFMSGTKGRRVITPNTSILSHQYSWGSGGKEHELFARVREFELSTARMLEHYKKCTGLSEKKVRDILLPPEDRWLSAKEAVKYGIADKIVSTY